MVALDRRSLFADTSLTGESWCRAHAELVDRWLQDLFAEATGGTTDGIALAAVGGYGRAELCPHSDIDVILLHDGRDDVAAIADRLWYPVWDTGLTLGHSVRTVRQALSLAQTDLDTATALLDVRHLAGDQSLSDDLRARALADWQKGARRALARLLGRIKDRHERAGEVAFLLEPDVKDGRGGLRDVHALGWAETARRPSNRLTLQDQDAVSHALHHADADALMATLAAAARTIAWTSDDTWRRFESSLRGPVGRIARRDRELVPGVVLRDGEVHVDATAVALYTTTALRAAALAAERDTVIDRSSLEALAHETRPLPEPWPELARHAFVALLATGRSAIRVIEALDQRGVWPKVLPEWRAVRSRPQRNAYHRFTVDRHLVEATANAAGLSQEVDRPDLVLVGTLLHDLGKGLRGDHTVRGIELAHRLGSRMGSGRWMSSSSPQWSSTICCCRTSPPAATSTTPAPSSRWQARSGRLRCSMPWRC